MELTRRISAVLGPTLLAVSISEAIHLEIWQDADPALVYLNGLLLLVAGLVIVTNHNEWRGAEKFLVTLSGWLLVAAGLFRMFLPGAQQLGEGGVADLVMAGLGVLGLCLSVAAFRKR